MKPKPAKTQAEQKPAVDLNSINTMLKNSFGAIKIDMLHLKEAQEEQLRDMGHLKKDLKDFKQTCATKDNLKRLKENVTALEAKQKLSDEKIIKLENYSGDIVLAVNERIKELNKEFDNILKIKDDLMFKLKTFDRLEDDFRDFKKTKSDKTQLQRALDDVSAEFDKIEEKLATKKDLLKLVKRVEKN